jgi:hypothetical protein
MSDEITIKPKSESTPATAAPENQTVSLGRTQLVNLCAAGLGVSFFLPWAQFLGGNVSGFDLQKAGDGRPRRRSRGARQFALRVVCIVGGSIRRIFYGVGFFRCRFCRFVFQWFNDFHCVNSWLIIQALDSELGNTLSFLNTCKKARVGSPARPAKVLGCFKT